MPPVVGVRIFSGTTQCALRTEISNVPITKNFFEEEEGGGGEGSMVFNR